MHLFTGPALAGLSLCLTAQDDVPKPESQKMTSGLVYVVLEPGPKDGERPKLGDRVKVHYTGWLESGVEFDSSRSRGAPAQFVLGQVIPGWNEGLQLMPVGARYKFTIPAELGYGKQGAGNGVIPPDATLIFDVELLGIERGPVFALPNEEALATTEAGVKYEIVKPGEGEELQKSDRVELRYGVWTPAGETVMNHLVERGPLRLSIGDVRRPFMQELLLKLKEGGVCRAIVPVALAFPEQRPPVLGDEENCVWLLEVVKVLRPLPLPEFKASSADKLVQTTSGLKYEILQPGTGKSPAPTDVVEVHYIGWLENGTVFDSSYGRGETTEFPLHGVIKGWTEGLQLMKEGAVYQFVIPPDLAYGAGGSPPTIPPNATLVFRIELIAVK